MSTPHAGRPQPRPRRKAEPVEEPVRNPVKPGRLPVNEFLYHRAGAASPFGDDVTFPLPSTSLTYRHS
jgi:hypothetical protein